MTTQLDPTEHVLRSVRGWLHALYPDEPIWINRKRPKDGAERPAFRLEITRGPDRRMLAQGVQAVDYNVLVRYASTGQWDAHRHLDRIQAEAMPPTGRIPLNLYNVAWPAPLLLTEGGAGGTLDGDYELAVVAEDAEGNRSAPSERQLITISGNEIDLETRAWPGMGLVRNILVYATDTEDGALKLQTTVAVPSGARPTDSVTATLSAYNGAGAAPLSNQRLPFSGLRVEGVDGSVMELPDVEDVWDALVTLRLCAYLQLIH
jgi:hypothetical protein